MSKWEGMEGRAKGSGDEEISEDVSWSWMRTTERTELTPDFFQRGRRQEKKIKGERSVDKMKRILFSSDLRISRVKFYSRQDALDSDKISLTSWHLLRAWSLTGFERKRLTQIPYFDRDTSRVSDNDLIVELILNQFHIDDRSEDSLNQVIRNIHVSRK